MPAVTTLRAAGKTDPGRQRAVNEDRLFVDAARGLFIVIDGVGGQAAGGKAADVALSMIRARLERETGPVAGRIREALTIANNEIHRLAGTRPEWQGMACVATVLVVDGARAFVGHVGDTRLYKLSPTGIQKITHDHSPVGEREDAGELSELEAMRHARRNEVYRDLGSDRHEPADPEFIDVGETTFEPDSALLLCSDGLTDLVDSSTISEVARQLAGDPHLVVSELVDAANRAGGKDNITVVYVEGDRFPAPSSPSRPTSAGRSGNSERYVRVALLVMLTILLVLSIDGLRTPMLLDQPARPPAAAGSGQLIVRDGDSIADALRRATPGTEVVVEPGEYREALFLPSHVRLISRVPAGAVLRLPANAQETDAAASASGVTGAALVGFRIVGDATTALGTGLLVHDSEVSIIDTDISGATQVAIDIAGRSRVSVMASKMHDNPGAALAVRSGASARITHNVFMRNGTSPHTVVPIILGENTDLTLASNIFHDVQPAVFGALAAPARAALSRDNWFADARPRRASSPSARGRGARGGSAPRAGEPSQP